MASGSEILTNLLFNIQADTATLKAGLDKANNQISGFAKGLSAIGPLLAGVFSAGAVIGFGKQLFDVASALDDVGDSISALGYTMDNSLNAGKAKAIADVFGTDVNKIIQAANNTAKQFGLTFNDALDHVQKGLAFAGTEQEKFLKGITNSANEFASVGGSADAFFATVTNGFATGTDWQKQLKEGNKGLSKSFSEVTSSMTDGQILQQKLINSTADLNTVLADTFGGSVDLVDELKVQFNEIAAKSLKAIANGVVSCVNFVIDLYNNSLYVRTIVQTTIFYWKEMWTIIKLIGQNIATVFSAAGALIKAVFTGNFKDIPKLYADAVRGMLENTKNFAAETGTNFKETVQNIFSKEPIKLIGDGEVQAQGQKVAQIFKESLSKGLKLQFIPEKDLPEKATKPFSSGDIAPEGSILITGLKTQTQGLIDAWKGFDEQLNITLGETLVNGINAAGDAFAGLLTGQKKGFKDFVGTFLGGIKQILNALLAKAIMGVLAGEAVKGLPGVIAGIAGIGIIQGIFNKLPSFEHGGNYSGGYALVGEAGPELINFNRGGKIFNNGDTSKMLNSSGNMVITVRGTIGHDVIYLSNLEGERQFGNTR